MSANKENIALEKGVKSLQDYIKNADHSQPASFELIFADELSIDELEHVQKEISTFESFKPLLDDDVLTEDQLDEMLSDLMSLV
jgi:hypothetical protein